MTAASLSLPARNDPIARQIVAAWRRLTGGAAVRDDARRTLVACSGGADSSALVLALATVSPPPVVGHVLHDLRPAPEAAADMERARALAADAGLEFRALPVRVASSPGNVEANARLARYDALATIARAENLPWVATAHHADDQLETMLLAMMRGAGPSGLAAIRPRRRLAEEVGLVRPMLAVRAGQARELCARCGWTWAEDRTNQDLSRRRAAIRATVTPAIRAIDPHAPAGAARTAHAMRSADRAIQRRAVTCLAAAKPLDRGYRFDRDALRLEPVAVLVEVLRTMHRLNVGSSGRDRLGQRPLHACIRVIRDNNGGERSLELANLKVVVTRNVVYIS